MSSYEEETQRFMQKVYAWMFAGLCISGAISYIVAITPALESFILGNRMIFYGLLIFELILVMGLVRMIKGMSGASATFMFLLYSFVSGLTLSVIFMVYELDSIVLIFFITAAMFGTMSIYGYVTKRDLTKMGQILTMALFGLIIAMLVNFILRNSMLDYILSAFGVVIFTGLTAHDTQKIKENNIIGNEGTDEDQKEAIMGALKLYLDFVNLFLDLLRLFGKRRR